MTFKQFYLDLATAVNDSDIAHYLPPWEAVTDQWKDFYLLLYTVCCKGAFPGAPGRNRASVPSSGKRKPKKLLANPRSGA